MDLVTIGRVESALTDRESAPKQGDEGTRPEQGVFNTRSPDRPNPIGLHRVTVVSITGTRLRVRDLEALDGTPIIDVKPLLRSVDER
jgi:tRNA (Thr-GGU) A37 N-methylase